MNFEYLETARLRLRKLTDVDYEQLLITASDADIMQILGISEQEVQKEKQKAERGFGMYNKAMVMFQIMQKQSNQVIGLCGFHIWYIQHNRAELGYMLNDDNHKQKG
ncbi:MAG: GNAT family N-acetyltransferase, partial [Bacteroidota bacterium]